MKVVGRGEEHQAAGGEEGQDDKFAARHAEPETALRRPSKYEGGDGEEKRGGRIWAAAVPLAHAAPEKGWRWWSESFSRAQRAVTMIPAEGRGTPDGAGREFEFEKALQQHRTNGPRP